MGLILIFMEISALRLETCFVGATGGRPSRMTGKPATDPGPGMPPAV